MFSREVIVNDSLGKLRHTARKYSLFWWAIWQARRPLQHIAESPKTQKPVTTALDKRAGSI